ncbi:MAG: thioredoxin family protein [bacterium]|jgi:thioredoxin 1|nr:thioredoxin family protein [bacterium]
MFETVDRWNFARKVLNSQGLILLNFWTHWNAECQRVSKLLHEFATHVGDQIQILKTDWDAQRKLAEELDVYGVPTLLIFNNGKLIRRYSGILTPEELLNIIKKHNERDLPARE